MQQNVDGTYRSFVLRLFAPVDAASLAFFRIGFGAILFWEVCRFFLKGRIHEYFVEPHFHFTYFGFEWVRPWPGAGMDVHFVLVGAAAAFVALGLWYRVAALAFFFGFSYVFLLEQARYLNHFYLVILLSGLLVVVPAHRAFAIDAWRRPSPQQSPAWAVWLLRAQIGLVYLHAGIAKLNPDWLRAQPLEMWLSQRSNIPLVGPILAQKWIAWVFSYGGMLLDLSAWPLLSWKRTRLATFAVLVAFHVTNSVVFDIGIFPWLMIVVTTLFFEPDWPRRWLGLAPAASSPPLAAQSAARRRLIVGLLFSYLTAQALIPLRHLLYPGSVHWTEEGHAFSWHMKLRGKQSQVSFLVTDPDSRQSWLIDPKAELTPRQVVDMGGRPDMILQYAHHLAEAYRARGHRRIEVRATASVSLNGRPYQLLVDPKVDLAAERRSLWPATWILELGP